MSWALWSTLLTIAFVNQIHNGGEYSTWFIGSTLALVLTVFVLSFKRGIGGAGKLDIACLLAAGILFIAWIVTKDTRATTYIVVLIDAAGAIPTIHKAYLHPETEAYLQWFTSAVAGLFSILAVLGHNFILIVYPAYVIMANSLIMIAKYLGTQRLTTRSRLL